MALIASCSSSSSDPADGSAGAAGGPPKGRTFCGLSGPVDPGIVVPAGFCIRTFATKKDVTAPRVIRFSPSGDVFVTAPRAPTPGGSFGGLGAIVVLPDDNHDGVSDGPVTYAGGNFGNQSNACEQHDADPTDLSCVHGLAFRDGYVYFTRRDDVRRFPFNAGDRTAPSAVGEVVVATLGTSTKDRFTHTLDASTTGPMYVSRGRFDAVACDMSGPIGAVLAIDLGAPLPATPTVVSQGLRNPMYLRCHPSTGACFANELSGDNWSGIGGREKLAVISAGSDWGYPCCVGKGAPSAPGVPTSVCASVDDALVSIPLHDTPFGMDFDRGLFPPPYRGAAFIALHGAFPTWVGTRLVYVPVDEQGMPVGPTAEFATGWGREATAKVEGRATDVAFAPDGRLFVVDDTGSNVWWIAPESLALPDGW